MQVTPVPMLPFFTFVVASVLSLVLGHVATESNRQQLCTSPPQTPGLRRRQHCARSRRSLETGKMSRESSRRTCQYQQRHSLCRELSRREVLSPRLSLRCDVYLYLREASSVWTGAQCELLELIPRPFSSFGGTDFSHWPGCGMWGFLDFVPVQGQMLDPRWHLGYSKIGRLEGNLKLELIT